MNLDSPVTEVKSISTKGESLLLKLGIQTIRDLITYFPYRYLDTTSMVSIKDLILNQEEMEGNVLIKAKVNEFKSNFIRGGKSIQRAIVEDATGSLLVSWFNQRYLSNAIKTGEVYFFYGKLKKSGSRTTFYPTTFEKATLNGKSIHLGIIVPEYKLTNGISKKVFRRWINNAIESFEKIEIPDEIKEYIGSEYNIKSLIKASHFPQDFETLDKALSLLSLYELVSISLKLIQKSKEKERYKAPSIPTSFNTNNIFTFIQNAIPYDLTSDQTKIIKKCLERIKEEKSINMIIQGDVGSGKTAIAIALALTLTTLGYQTALVAPTTILAKQHFNTFNSLLEKLKISVNLVSSENKEFKNSQILIGTSAIFSRKIQLVSNLGLVIVDEQHKFGVEQREDLIEYIKSANNKFLPHIVNLSATPIPRTIAQIAFNDIELETISTLPKGRKPIKTLLVPEFKREDSIEWIRKALKNREQIYWVCPLVLENESEQNKSVISTHKKLQEVFSEFKVGLLHGKLKEKEKNEVMTKFKNQDIDLLVSTSVIEVGIDVPNASIVVIENAERFGLAQLHQIRGRVGRSSKASWCLLFHSPSASESSINRLKFISKNTNGMEIAEFDLLNRGPGEIYGTIQSGIPNLKLANIRNLSDIKKAMEIAKELDLNLIKEINLFK